MNPRLAFRPPEPNYSRTAHCSSFLSPSSPLVFHSSSPFKLFPPLPWLNHHILNWWKNILFLDLDHAKSRSRPPRIAMQWRVGPVYSLGARDIADCNQFSCNTGLNIQSQLFNTISSWDQNAFIFINQLTFDEHFKLIQVKRIIGSMTQHS